MKNNRIINKELLEEANSWDMIASGYFTDEGSTNICGTGKELKWVAVRWWIPDWAVYYEYAWSELSRGNDRIRKVWDKFPKSMVHELFDSVSPEAIKVYRT